MLFVNKNAVLAWAVLSVVTSSAYADNTKKAEERVQHYAFEEPKNQLEARKLYSDSMDEIDQVLTKHTLDDNDLEDVHRISYALEAAVEKFEKGHAFKEEALEEMEESVQALHYASENHQEGDTRKWFAKLKTVTPQPHQAAN